jgi:hypothetical protein
MPARWEVSIRPVVLGLASCLLLLGTSVIAAQPKKTLPPTVAANVPRGLHEKPFELQLTAPANAVVRYTLDGTEPTTANGRDFTDHLTISNTTLLRAAAFREGKRITAISTHSFIFLDSVLRQPAAPPGFPAGPRAWGGQRSVYGMDPSVVNAPAYRDRITDAFKSLPIVSIVGPKDDLFGTANGLYLHSMERGDEWERACSAEMILPDGATAFQVDCGIRVQGNYNRLPAKSPKHSFRLLFREKYGTPKLHYQVFPDSPLKKFDTLVLRADYNNSWIHWDPEQRPRAQRTRDAWMKDSQRAMGWMSGHNRYVHLFLHGLYWGVYDLAERPDGDFAAAYLGGKAEDYDVVNEFQAKDGTVDAFRALHSIHGLTQNAQLEKLRQHLNLTQYVDYLLLNYYAGNQDWGENKNWYAIRRRTPASRFQYIVWDGEQVFHDVNDDCVSSSYETPFRLAEELKRNAEFRLMFADRVQRHFFGEGALTPAACSARWMKRAAEVDPAMIAESARWGYYRNNPAFTRDRDWIAEQKRLTGNYFPRRTGVVLKQLQSAGLYPRISAPIWRDETFAAPEAGKIYFSTNGLDPRVPMTGAVAPHAIEYHSNQPISRETPLKARVVNGTTWSALLER